jgi:hypothetical protein
MLRNRAVFAVGAGALLVLSLASPTHAAPKANHLGPEVALAAPNIRMAMWGGLRLRRCTGRSARESQ